MKAFFLSLNPDSPKRGYWDQGIIEDLLSGRLWMPATFEPFEVHEVSKLPKTDRAIVVLAGPAHAQLVDQLNRELAKVSRCVLFLTSDEEALFPVEDLVHPNIETWVVYPRQGRHDAYHKLGTGYPPQIRMTDEWPLPDKTVDLFFSGQITHDRRQQLRQYMPALSDLSTDFNGTAGFTQGMAPPDYYRAMSKAKIAPAPSGAVHVDSFRLFEALELMAVPIADELSPQTRMVGYWHYLFDDIVPFPTIRSWSDLEGYSKDILAGWPNNLHRITAWWIRWKRKFAYTVFEQLNGAKQ